MEKKSFIDKIINTLFPSTRAVKVPVINSKAALIPYDTIKESFTKYCTERVYWPIKFYFEKDVMIATDSVQRKFTLNLNTFVLDIADLDGDGCSPSDDHSLKWMYELIDGKYKLRVKQSRKQKRGLI